MGKADLMIPALDGFPLAATLYRPAGAAGRRVIVINSAVGVQRRFYGPYAAFLRDRNYTVLCYDYRGTGGSTQLSARHARLKEWGESDFGGVLAWVRAIYPETALGCIGHSFGGQIPGLTPHARHIRAFLGIAAQSGYWRHWDKCHWPKLLLSWYVLIPVITTVLGYMPGALIGGQALPGTAARDWARWCRTAHYMSDDDGRPLRLWFRDITCPALFYAMADDDAFAPLPAVRALSEFYCHAASQIFVVHPGEWGVTSIGHFGFFRKVMPSALWRQTADWFDLHLSTPER